MSQLLSSLTRPSRQIILIGVVAVFLLVGPLGAVLHQPTRQAVTGYVAQKHSQWFAPTPSVELPCDPNLQPGYPHPQALYWKTDNPSCPGYEYHDALRTTPRDQLWDKFPELRNKSLLIAGDSVGRHLAETLCYEYLQNPLVNTNPPDFPAHYGWSSLCELKELGFKVAMVHIYGMANTSDPAVNEVLDKTYIGADWDLQSRIHRWFNTTLKDFVPDYVQLNSGAWEYRYWFIRDILQNESHDDLPLEDRESAAHMAIQSLSFFEDLWPKAKVWYLHMSMMNEDDLVVKNAHGKTFIKGDPDKADSYPPMYTWRRQAQYRETMRRLIAEAGYESLDYVQIQQVMSRKEFSLETDVIHPQYPAKRVMSSMIMNKIRRHVDYGV